VSPSNFCPIATSTCKTLFYGSFTDQYSIARQNQQRLHDKQQVRF
jgi:hypothetical protein